MFVNREALATVVGEFASFEICKRSSHFVGIIEHEIIAWAILFIQLFAIIIDFFYSYLIVLYYFNYSPSGL